MKRAFDDSTTPAAAPTSERSEVLIRLLHTCSRMVEISSHDIVYMEPIVSWKGDDSDSFGLLYAGSITQISGQSGTHKSRLCEQLASFLVAKERYAGNFLNYRRSDTSVYVVYADTERNTTEELPLVIQRIKRNAGYEMKEEVPNLRVVSLKSLSTDEKQEGIREFLQHVRAQLKAERSNASLVVILDVLTDISGVNDSERAIETINWINQLSEENNCSFVIAIHQNPGTEKSRGHAGTEVTNKCSVHLSLQKQTNDRGESTGAVLLRFPKLRHSAPQDTEYLSYCRLTEFLRLANNEERNEARATESQSATDLKVISVLEDLFSQGNLHDAQRTIDRTTIQKEVYARHSISDKTLQRTLKKVVEQEAPLMIDGKKMYLIPTKSGRQVAFELIPWDTPPTPF